MSVEMVPFIAIIVLVFYPLTAISRINIDQQHLPIDNLINLYDLINKDSVL